MGKETPSKAEPIAETTSNAITTSPDDETDTGEDVAIDIPESASQKAEELSVFLQGVGYVRTGDLEFTNSTWGIKVQLELHEDGSVSASTFRDNDVYKPRFEHVTVDYLRGQIP